MAWIFRTEQLLNTLIMHTETSVVNPVSCVQLAPEILQQAFPDDIRTFILTEVKTATGVGSLEQVIRTHLLS